MHPIMVTIPAWLLIVIVVGVAAVSGIVFWAVGRFLFRKGGDSVPEEDADPQESRDSAPVVQPSINSQKGESIMANPVEIKKELDRAAQNLTKLTTALRNERTGRAEDNRANGEIIATKDKEIADMQEQMKKLTGEKEAQGAAVAQGAASVADANKDAEAALADP